MRETLRQIYLHVMNKESATHGNLFKGSAKQNLNITEQPECLKLMKKKNEL
jgi:hypothetical protein